jgi:outer membrane protein
LRLIARRLESITFESELKTYPHQFTINYFLNKIINNQKSIRNMIKRILLAAAAALVLTFSANAQKIAIVDINQVLNSLADYKKAQEDLDKIAQKWRGDIAQQQDVIKGLYNRYQAEQVLLNETQRKQREEEIMNKEKEVREAQRVKFGSDGELFKRRQELVKPIQDKVYAAIERFATDKGYDIILDKSSSAGLIFANPTYDKTSSVIDLVKKM